jgi:hypothetical protein
MYCICALFPLGFVGDLEYAIDELLVSLSIDSPGIVRISTGEIFSAHTIGVLVRPLDFKPPITITLPVH